MNNNKHWQGRGHFETFGGPPVQIVGNAPKMRFSARRSRARMLDVAQQIIDEFDPGHTVSSLEADDDPPRAELRFTDGTVRKLTGLFAKRILDTLKQ